MSIKYASVCDGIGAAHAAWAPIGWRCAWSSEIDPFPEAVVDQRWGLPNLGDMTKINTEEAIDGYGRISLIVGGTPCQSFSVAGLRAGLDDPRGNLALVFLGLADKLRPEWVVWENVPGVLSSSEGRDFGSFVGGLAELGYGWAYRVLDAQYVRVESHPFAVPQRRKRVFVVGHLGSWQRAAAVLFEREGMRGHPPPSRRSGQGFAADIAPCLVSSGRGVERSGDTRGQDPLVAFYQNQEGEVRTGDIANTLSTSSNANARQTPNVMQPYPVANCMTRRMHKGINTTVDEGQTPVLAFGKAGRAREVDGVETWVDGEIANTINAFDVGDIQSTNLAVSNDKPKGWNIAFNDANGTRKDRPNGGLYVRETEISGALSLAEGDTKVQDVHAVRRLMPVECERLQGFPDGYTAIKFRGKPASDSARYKALGNSMAVNVMSWIGQRIEAVHELGTSKS